MFSATYNYVKKATLGELIQMIAGGLAIIAIAFGVFFNMEARYAKADETKEADKSIGKSMKALERRLDYKITSDQYKETRSRIWEIEYQMRGKPIDQWPKLVRDEYQKLQEELKELDRDLSAQKAIQKEVK